MPDPTRRSAPQTALCCALILVSLTALSSCSKDEDPPLSPSLTEWTSERGDRFPLAVGNRWEYRAVTEVTDLIDPARSHSLTTLATLQVTAREPVLGHDAFRIDVTHHVNRSRPDTVVGHSWFTMSGDTLLGLATLGDMGSLEPVFAQLCKPTVAESPQAWGLASLVFPLHTGKSWPLLPDTELTAFAGRRKTVDGVETVTVPAGTFDTFRLVDQMRGMEGVEGRVTQWFSTAGMVRCEEETSAYGLVTDTEGNVSQQPQALQRRHSLTELTGVHLVDAR